MSDDGTCVSATALTHSYGSGRRRRTVLSEISFKISEGTICVVTGVSGSGKTTLLSIIGTLLRPDGGELNVLGQDPLELSPKELPALRRRIGYVFQTPTFIEDMSVEDNIEIYSIINQVDPEQALRKAPGYLKRFGIPDVMRMRPKEMSGGERQRLALVLPLLKGAELILADEPLGSLDPGNREKVKELLQELRKEGVTTVIVSHDTSLVEIADKHIELTP